MFLRRVLASLRRPSISIPSLLVMLGAIGLGVWFFFLFAAAGSWLAILATVAIVAAPILVAIVGILATAYFLAKSQEKVIDKNNNDKHEEKKGVIENIKVEPEFEEVIDNDKHEEKIEVIQEIEPEPEEVTNDDNQEENIEVIQESKVEFEPESRIEKYIKEKVGEKVEDYFRFFTKLYNAVNENNIKLVESLLLNKDVDPNRILLSNSIEFPLHLACDNNNFEIVRLLLKHPLININILNLYGETALHMVCKKKDYNKEILELLLENGADPNIEIIKNEETQTPFSMACQQYEKDESLNKGASLSLICLLLSYGARIDDFHVDSLKHQKIYYFILLLQDFGTVKNVFFYLKDQGVISQDKSCFFEFLLPIEKTRIISFLIAFKRSKLRISKYLMINIFNAANFKLDVEKIISEVCCYDLFNVYVKTINFNIPLIKELKKELVKQNISVIMDCLIKGADLDCKDKHGDTARQYFLKHPKIHNNNQIKRVLNEQMNEVINSDLVKFFLLDLSTTNKAWSTALHTACHIRDTQLIKWLLDNKIDPDIKNEGNFSYLEMITYNYNINVLKLLLEYGANPNVEISGKVDAELFMALNLDLLPNILEKMSLLLSYGADGSNFIDIPESVEGQKLTLFIEMLKKFKTVEKVFDCLVDVATVQNFSKTHHGFFKETTDVKLSEFLLIKNNPRIDVSKIINYFDLNVFEAAAQKINNSEKSVSLNY